MSPELIPAIMCSLGFYDERMLNKTENSKTSTADIKGMFGIEVDYDNNLVELLSHVLLFLDHVAKGNMFPLR